jgi:hypothetical protein
MRASGATLLRGPNGGAPLRALVIVIATDTCANVIASDPGRLLGTKRSPVTREIASFDPGTSAHSQ